MMRSKILTVLISLSVAVGAEHAGAQGSSEASDTAIQKEARALFDKGKALGKKNDWQGAYDALLRSFELRASHDTAANLAYAAQKAGKHADAARYAAFAIRHMPTAEPEEKRKVVAKMLEEAKKRVATVHLTTDPRSAEILIDDASIGSMESLEDPVFLMPGEHVIEARAAGHEPARERIVATQGAERALSLKLVQASSTASPGALPDSGLGRTQAPPSRSDSRQNGKADSNILPVALIGGGVAVIGLGVGVGFLLAGNSKKSDADELRDETRARGGCAVDPAACRELQDEYASADSRYNISTIGFVTAGVAALGTLAYVLLSPEPRGAATRGIRPTIGIGADGGPSFALSACF